MAKLIQLKPTYFVEIILPGGKIVFMDVPEKKVKDFQVKRAGGKKSDFTFNDEVFFGVMDVIFYTIVPMSKVQDQLKTKQPLIATPDRRIVGPN